MGGPSKQSLHFKRRKLSQERAPELPKITLVQEIKPTQKKLLNKIIWNVAKCFVECS